MKGRKGCGRVRVIGLTGGIATGKSTASRYFQEAGVPVVDADLLARRVVEPGQPAWKEIREEFGEGVLRPDGSLNREALAELVFHDPCARNRLNAIVHPRVAAEASREVTRLLAEEPDGVVVYDVPLLFETGSEDRFDLVAVVYVPRTEQIRRLRIRDGLSREAAEQRLASQLDIEEKARRADVVLDNRGSRDALRAQVLELIRRAVRRVPAASPP
ncbi:MAG: dephospho-CoA kinase [Deferrisomatales bacterium]|nr:dephospho-CoA kinase [Deferrisomatales bacterium]